MPLVKGKEKFQVTIPAEVREAVQLSVGDILEATVQGANSVLTPKAVIDRETAGRELITLMERVHAKQRPRKKSPKKQEEDITRIIKAYRREHAKQRT
jgi:AbrB family looped-hinge helix DNA binding protein